MKTIVVAEKGTLKTTLMAEALQEYSPNSEKAKKGNGDLLPSLDQAKAMVMEDVFKEKMEAAKRREWVEGAAPLVIKLTEEIGELEAVVYDGGILSIGGKKKLNGLKAKREEIINAGDEEVRKHLCFAMTMAEIRSAVPTVENVKRFLALVMDEFKRWRLATAEEVAIGCNKKSWPEGTLFFHGKTYFSVFPSEKMTPAQRAMAVTLAKFIKQVKDVKKKTQETEQDKMAELIKAGGENLLKFQQGEPGAYVLVFYGDKWSHGDGVGVINLRQKEMPDKAAILIVEVVDGAGTLAWLGQHKGKYIPFSWFRKREVSDNASNKEFAERFIKMLGAGFMAYKARTNQ